MKVETSIDDLRATSVQSPAVAARFTMGTVGLIDADEYRVFEDGLAYAYRVAASCLIRPQMGDLILCTQGESGKCFVLAVLQRARADAPAIDLGGDAWVRVGGRLRIEAGQGVAIHAPEFDAAFESVNVRSKTATLSLSRLDAFIGTARATFADLLAVAKSMSSVVERLHVHATNSSRTVERADQLTAGTIDHRAQGLMNLHAENVLVAGEQLVKTRGAQIHFG